MMTAVSSESAPASGSWGRAVVNEVRATLGTWWWQEMTNPNLKTLAVSFFLYLACVAPAITCAFHNPPLPSPNQPGEAFA